MNNFYEMLELYSLPITILTVGLMWYVVGLVVLLMEKLYNKPKNYSKFYMTGGAMILMFGFVVFMGLTYSMKT